MPLVIPDDMLAATGLNERDDRLELACRAFDAGTLASGRAAAWAGVSESEFEEESASRKIPRYRYTDEMLAGDVESLKKLGRW